MALSRYRNSNTIDGKFFESSDLPNKKELDKIPVFKIRVTQFDRLDNLAFKHFGSGEYWWVIALINDLDWAFEFEEGQILDIPINVQDVLELI